MLNTLDLYPKEANNTTDVLFINFGAAETAFALPAATTLREAGLGVEIYPDATKMKKQMAYANAKEIPFVVMAGEEEMNEGVFTVKNMLSGEQQKVKETELKDFLFTNN